MAGPTVGVLQHDTSYMCKRRDLTRCSAAAPPFGLYLEEWDAGGRKGTKRDQDRRGTDVCLHIVCLNIHA